MYQRTFVAAALVVLTCSQNISAAEPEGGPLREPFDQNE